jgi:hypothetical protein
LPFLISIVVGVPPGYWRRSRNHRVFARSGKGRIHFHQTMRYHLGTVEKSRCTYDPLTILAIHTGGSPFPLRNIGLGCKAITRLPQRRDCTKPWPIFSWQGHHWICTIYPGTCHSHDDLIQPIYTYNFATDTSLQYPSFL